MIIDDKSSGALTIQGDEDTVVLTFEFGLCVQVESHYPRFEHRLGQLLIHRGLISLQQLDSLLEQQKSSLKKLGYLIREAGLISAIQLMECLEDQMQLILYPCFTWTKGLYFFRSEDVVYYDKTSSRPLDLLEFIEIGDKILKNWEWIKERIPSFDLAPSIQPQIQALPPGVQVADGISGSGRTVVMTVEQEKIYNIINGLFPVSKLIDTCHQFPYFSYMALLDLQDVGIITLPITESVKKNWFTDYKDAILASFKQYKYGAVGISIFIFLALALLIPRMSLHGFSNPVTIDEMIIHSKEKMDQIRFALRSFQFLNGEFPVFLSAIVDENLLAENDLLDRWNMKFLYRKTRAGFILISGGPDKAWATQDDIQFQERGIGSSGGSFFPSWSQTERHNMETEN